ncbi:MAG: PP2C family protein-serine/threonine phosphatase [Candidatus Krumholzibacteria bacterium]|nr:PP2C family protein-serine/threonine phosphatase [Candidatus Krumholzibacteria bacterium]
MIDPKVFQPKAFYRKLDALLTRIGEGASMKEMLSLVLDELVESVGEDLGIKSGCVYHLSRKAYRKTDQLSGSEAESWPASIPKEDESIKLLSRHKNYIFVDTVDPPWGKNSVAVLFSEDDEYLLVFMLEDGWVRETLEFSLNTIRSTLNFSSSTSRFSADLQEAYEIQKSLLPRIEPEFEGYEIAGRMEAAERVGGDLYDFSVLEEGVLSFAVGDASGHGLPAALLARDVVTGLRMGMEKEMKISSVLRKLNNVIYRSRLSTRFISLFYGELEPKGTLVYVNAGHPTPILFKSDSIERLDVGGTILGPLENTDFNRGFAFMEPGDLLVLYTDGILEATNTDGDIYDEGRLIEFVKANISSPAHEIIRGLFAEIRDFAGSVRLQDDTTAVVIRRQ